MNLISITTVQANINNLIDKYHKKIESNDDLKTIYSIFVKILVNIRNDLSSAKNNILNMI